MGVAVFSLDDLGIDAPAAAPYGPPPFARAVAVTGRIGAPIGFHLMPLSEIISPRAIVPALKVVGKKQLLQELAQRAAALTGESERDIFELLMQRERLGSTGIGSGIAIPHCKLPHVTRLHGLFARLDRPIDFEALDGRPVDLVFLLIAPEGAGADHLQALARVARLLRDEETAMKLRQTRDPEAMFALLAVPIPGAE